MAQATTSDQALAVVVAQKKDELTKNVTAEESTNLTNSLLFQYNWPDLLQSAPTAINSMGACFIAASSPKAAVTLDPPTGGYKYLRYTSLQANLVQTANLGMFAFNAAETGMGQVSQASDILYDKLKDVINMLGDPQSAKVMLKPQLTAVQKSANTCAETASKIEVAFNDWLFYACEMHAACVQQQQTAADAYLSNQACIAAEQVRLKTQQDTVQKAKDAADKLGKQVDVTSEAFKKASDSCPSGWDIVGQQIVGDLANCATTALKAMIPALVSSINPVAGFAEQGQGIVGGFVNKGAPPPTGTAPNGAPSSIPPPPDNTKVMPPADPAATALVKDMTYIELLNAIVNGTDGGIDWEKARGSGDATDANAAKTAISFVSSMLSDAKASFDSITTATPTSAKVSTILDTTAKIAAGILDIVQKSKDISASWPASDDPEVKQWEADFRAQYLAAHEVAAVTVAQSGGSTTTAIMSNAQPATGDDLKAGQTQAQAILEASTNRLNTTQAAYLATQDNYVKASNLLVEQSQRLSDIAAKLAKLASDNVTLAEIKSILIESIKLIIQLKSQINCMVQFFSAFTVIISTVIQTHVDPFIDCVERMVSNGGTDPTDTWQVGNYSLTDMMRTNVYSSVLTLRTYFSVFGDIAKMWMQLSINNIQPGIKLCNELSVMDSNSKDVGNKMQALTSWSDKASKDVQQIVGDKQKQIMQGFDSRIQDISSTTKLLPPTVAQPSIQQGATDQTTAVSQALAVKQASSPMNRFNA